jgi:hypothetical protein
VRISTLLILWGFLFDILEIKFEELEDPHPINALKRHLVQICPYPSFLKENATMIHHAPRKGQFISYFIISHLTYIYFSYGNARGSPLVFSYHSPNAT